jgi:hypothetical protein
MDESLMMEEEIKEMEHLVDQVFMDIKVANPFAFPPF